MANVMFNGASARVPVCVVVGVQREEEEDARVVVEGDVVMAELDGEEVDATDYVLGLQAQNGLVLEENARQRRRIAELEAVVERLAVKLRVLEEKRRVKRPRCRFC